MQQVICTPDLDIPLYTDRVKKYEDKMKASGSLTAAVSRLTLSSATIVTPPSLVRTGSSGSSHTSGTTSSTRIMIYGLSMASIAAALAEAKAYLAAQHEHVSIDISPKIGREDETFLVALTTSLASLHAWVNFDWASRKLTLHAMGKVALSGALKEVTLCTWAAVLAEIEVKPPKYWDPAHPGSKKVSIF